MRRLGPRGGNSAVVRKLGDDTLIVFLSDCHIGGDNGRDIFESPDDLAALFADLDRIDGPVELVLAGDFFDCLRIGTVPAGQNRAGATIARPEYREVFAVLRRFAAGKGRRVVYLPGNHDAEVWWNQDIRTDLAREGLVYEFALSYTASFASDPGRVVYCEHGNEFDESNAKRNYTTRSTRRSATTSSPRSSRACRAARRLRRFSSARSTTSFRWTPSRNGSPGGCSTRWSRRRSAGCWCRSSSPMSASRSWRISSAPAAAR